jgi:hypothetical protein
MIQSSETRDVLLAINQENFEQMMNAAVNKLASRRVDDKKIFISNQVHSDKSVVHFFLAGNTFTAGELEFAQNANSAQADSTDMNLVILKEMVNESGVNWHLENKADRQGNILGMGIRFTVNRVPKEAKNKNLVSVVRGKKKDIVRDLIN